MVSYGHDLWGRGSNHTRDLSKRVSRTFNVCQISTVYPLLEYGMSRKTSTSCRCGCPNAKTMTRVQLVVNPSNLQVELHELVPEQRSCHTSRGVR